MTLEQISEKTGVSPATITRTASEIGYRGYPGLLQAARQTVRRDMAPVERLDHTLVHEGSTGYNESVNVDRRNLETMLQLNSSETIRRTVDLLASAPHVYLFTSRTSYGCMSFFAYVLGQIRPHVTLLTEAEGRIVDLMLDLGEDDVFFLADLPRYSKVVISCAKEARSAGCRVISITDGPSSPFAQLSDVSLFVPYDSYSFFNSNVSTLSLCNALATALNLKLKETSRPRLDRHNALLRRFSTLIMQKEPSE